MQSFIRHLKTYDIHYFEIKLKCKYGRTFSVLVQGEEEKLFLYTICHIRYKYGALWASKSYSYKNASLAFH